MKFLKTAFSLLLLLSAATGFGTIGQAQTPDPDPQAFQTIISSQIDAFRRDEGTQAFSFASPGIKRQFGTPANFMDMVRRGYPQVYRPKDFRFGKVTNEMGGRPTQRVHIVDGEGRLWTALYAFEQQPDGSWKISGVVIVRDPEGNA